MRIKRIVPKTPRYCGCKDEYDMCRDHDFEADLPQEAWERKMQKQKLNLMRMFLALAVVLTLLAWMYGLPVTVVGD